MIENTPERGFVASLDGIQAEVYGLEGNGFDGARLCATAQSRERGGSLKLAIDGYVGVLVEARIGLHTGFRLFAAFEDAEVVVEEA